MSDAAPPRKAPDQPWRAEGTPDEPPRRSGRFRGGKWWGLLATAVIVFVLAYVGLHYFGRGDEPTISYTQFSKEVGAGNVATIYPRATRSRAS
ncbi:hypothetical protein LT493_19015 [Streptomyces tricolor]|nr:hypothetical protein [Streptomyces tricolor]